MTVVDAQGRIVPHADHDITIAIDGPATLLGLENGDPIDSTNYKLNHRKAFHGMMLAIVQLGDDAERGTLTAGASGLRGAACGLASA